MSSAVEETQPAERFALVAAQLPDEAVGDADRRGVDFGGRGQQVGRPSAPNDIDTTAERRTVDAEREPQHLGARELGRARAFGERCCRGREVGAVDRDPTFTGADQRSCLLRERSDLGGRQLDAVEHRRPPHVGELVRSDLRLGAVDEHA
jgi:hypothetical protein